jgi:hypothetical protein
MVKIIIMKKLTKLTYALAVAVVLGTSCNKLDEFNPAGTTGEEIWTTPAGFTTLVNGAYRDIHSVYGSEPGLLFGEAGTDLWINQSGRDFANQYLKHEGMTPTQGTLKEVWSNLWNGINMCNTGISYIDKAGFTDPVEKNRRLGELKFMRALYYFHIVESYGGVMLRTEPTTSAIFTATRSKPEEFYDLMIADLLFAKDNLPKDWGTVAASSEYARASKKSAAGLLARVYLTRAYYSTGADATAWFTKAKDAALDVINNKTAYGCDLYATPADLWNPANNEVNKESLFTVSYSLTNVTYSYSTTNGNRMFKWYATKYSGYPGLLLDQKYGYDNDQRLMPTWHLLDLFDETKDARYDASFQENWYSNTKQYAWKSGDATTFFKNWTDVSGKTIDSLGLAMQITKGVIANKASLPYLTFDRNDTYLNPVPGTPAKYNTDATRNKYFVYLKKFLDPYRPATNTAGGFSDVFAIRFAEMYMIAAESFFQLNDNGSAATYINVLRTRAAKAGQAPAMQIGAGDITLNFILDERAREFCGEQLRYYDLKRVFRGDDFAAYITLNNPNITAVTKNSRLRPIPQSEMDALLNSGEFGQNPGYQ